MASAAAKSVILVVDDHRSLLVALERHLRQSGFRALCIESPKLALRILETWPVSVVVADLRMPEMDGLELLDRIHTRWPYCGRVLLTGDPGAVEQECERRGVDVIDKGRPFSELIEKLWFLTGARNG